MGGPYSHSLSFSISFHSIPSESQIIKAKAPDDCHCSRADQPKVVDCSSLELFTDAYGGVYSLKIQVPNAYRRRGIKF